MRRAFIGIFDDLQEEGADPPPFHTLDASSMRVLFSVEVPIEAAADLASLPAAPLQFLTDAQFTRLGAALDLGTRPDAALRLAQSSPQQFAAALAYAVPSDDRQKQ